MMKSNDTLKINKTLYNNVGMAIRAGKVFVGEKLQEKMNFKKVYLVVVAKDASKSFIESIPQGIKVIEFDNQTNLGLLVNRPKINGFGIGDSNLAKLISKTLMTMKGEINGEKE
ncbi:MAG TPA: hypothetical protein DCY93_01915 [Firmicutes bacterium]|nr:hypothetical protein [Bacillota bacterium]